jgi:hypothetical protein
MNTELCWTSVNRRGEIRAAVDIIDGTAYFWTPEFGGPDGWYLEHSGWHLPNATPAAAIRWLRRWRPGRIVRGLPDRPLEKD